MISDSVEYAENNNAGVHCPACKYYHHHYYYHIPLPLSLPFFPPPPPFLLLIIIIIIITTGNTYNETKVDYLLQCTW